MHVLTDVQEIDLFFTALDARDNPARIDGVPTWTTSDASKIAVVPSTDGLTAVARSAGPLTSSGEVIQVTVTVDADLGSGVRPITGIWEFTVIADEASIISTSAGQPRRQVGL
jgi:hypothetical protein